MLTRAQYLSLLYVLYEHLCAVCGIFEASGEFALLYWHYLIAKCDEDDGLAGQV